MRPKSKRVPGVARKTPDPKDEKMRTRLPPEPAPDFRDPRLRRGFQVAAWPLCNGNLAPLPGTSDLHERRCIEFLAAYYRLNELNQRLVAARENSAPKDSIRSLLSNIDKATVALEKLEDRYVSIGFFGEPVMEGIYYRDIIFVRLQLPRIYPSPQSSHIAIPGLAEIPQSELRGPVKIIRIGRGKMDL